MKFVKQSLLTVLLTSGLASGAALAQAQDTQKTASAAAQQEAAPQIDVSEQQVENFVEAYVAVQTIAQQYQPQIQTAGDKAKAAELQEQARGKMKTAITDTGLKLGEYKQIALAANQSESLRKRIAAEISEVTQSQQG
ncbi:DUF4168 domain-containing protein [Alteromonas sp. ASW11-19]|uniref:DUF4168 domain-containing protein n=1 Tax=Alteromonas salexigens TaxID=2982530 RepID=A0ABT2VIZ1_9ALTE|nr:DUF4168 domain-containing protein [Alteromonas salexigens]MCU7553158.1 DUF4168 domain-containing protein [Alteromonas salexigens]